MEITTRRNILEGEKEDEQPLSPAARLFHAPEFNCNIISVIGIKSKMDPDVIMRGFKQTFIRHPRFSSKLVSERWRQWTNQRWVRTDVVVEEHVIVPEIKPQNIENTDAFLEDYVSDLMKIPLDTSRPLWELHILDLKTSDAENVAVFKIHHSVGDGMSIMSLVLACMRKTSNPDELPSLPYQKRSSSLLTTATRSDSRLLWLVKLLWTAVILGLNTVCDVLEFLVTTLFVKDTETPIKGDFRSKKSEQLRLVHRTVSLDDIKLIKNAMNMTINGVVLGVTQASLSRYLERRYGEDETKRKPKNLLKRIRLRSALLVNLRPTTGIQDLADMMEKGSKCWWGNRFGYLVFPFSIALRNDPLEHLKTAHKTINRKKNSFGAMLTYVFCRIIVKSLGIEVAATIINRLMSNTTMTFSNMVGPVEEVSFYGHPITCIASSAYGHPHALTIHCQSYMNKMTITLLVDPTVISDPQRLCEDWEESLRSIKAAVHKRGSPLLWDYLRLLSNRVAWLLYKMAGIIYKMM
ncbi:PREDICTED: O-acyltransferase WSD1-like [Camelina sativa]|uniref:O-acyltransferase WSD1-like n=1 Tax=Camelina sativa TaxID=90675 RepID=A0ABM0YNC4_CAMSA|nr:PREDICTED: O-acyltransferase WSD1-like [Camelina sativa]